MKLETTIPFSGFYNSVHSENIDNTIEFIFQNDQGEILNKDCLEYAQTHLENYALICRDYAQNYVDYFKDHFETESLEFVELTSPTYYNYTTDRIFCSINLAELGDIFIKMDKSILYKVLKDNFTSYNGFISHYSNKLTDWPENFKDWDHNQIGALITAYCLEIEPDLEHFLNSSLVPDNHEYITDSLNENAGEEFWKYVDISDYLRRRQERKVSNSAQSSKTLSNNESI